MMNDSIITLSEDTPPIKKLCNSDKRLAKVIHHIGPLSYSNVQNEYAFLVHEIIEQMLSIKAGNKIYSRLLDKCNGSITPENINQINVESLREIGVSSAKSIYIKELTESVLEKRIDLLALKNLNDDEVIHSLTQIRGIGNWTAKMFLIFVLDRKDILPFEDGAFLQSFAWLYKTSDLSKQSISKKCQKWKPYSSIAARYLYRALDMGLTKNEFHLYKTFTEVI